MNPGAASVSQARIWASAAARSPPGETAACSAAKTASAVTAGSSIAVTDAYSAGNLQSGEGRVTTTHLCSAQRH
jgi:hypothetical protein